MPFSEHRRFLRLVVVKVLSGEHPGRPQGTEGALLVGQVWGLSERCWTPQPKTRPGIEDILRCLEDVSASNISASVLAIYKRLEKLDPSNGTQRLRVISQRATIYYSG